jgi:hypothetical protein
MTRSKTKVVTEKIAEKISLLKKIYNLLKAWVIGNGIEGILGLVVGLVLWVLGYKISAGLALGVFATRNWDIFKVWIRSVFGK